MVQAHPGLPNSMHGYITVCSFIFLIYMFTCVSKYISTTEYLCVYIGFEKIASCCQHPPKKKTIETFHLYMSNANVKSIKWPGSIMHPGCAAFQAATRPWGSTRQTAKVKASTCLDHGHSQTQTRLNKSSSLPMFVVSRFFKERTPYVTNKQGSKCGHNAAVTHPKVAVLQPCNFHHHSFPTPCHGANEKALIC